MKLGRDGNVAITFAIAAPALLAAVGVAIDFQQIQAQRQSLQDAADNLAIHGAKELLLENATKQGVESLMKIWAQKQYFEKLGSFTATPDVTTADKTASIMISQPGKPDLILTKIFKTMTPVVVHATAKAEGVTNVCVIALNSSSGDAVHADTASNLSSPSCAILSNSTSTTGINVTSLAKLKASLICSGGGYGGSTLNYSPLPITDCPIYADPLANRPPPSVGACDYTDFKIGSSSGKLSKAVEDALAATISTLDGATPLTFPGYTRYDVEPGVYCGGMNLSGLSDVHFAPGIYVMKDGDLTVDSGARMWGEGVGVYLSGNSIFDFRKSAIAHITAPSTGLMAGLLFWESSTTNPGKTYRIKSSNARTLLGTIYLPTGTLKIDTVLPIADASAYTALVVDTLYLTGSPTLVLNTYYKATTVPVPDGVGPIGGQVFLRN